MMTTIFAIADLHLSDGDKPMDVFGEHWKAHDERIYADWRARVGYNDIVLMPGDLSWAMQLAQAGEHLKIIGSLPGRKLLIKGNHDYWWNSISRVRDALPQGMQAIQNDCVEMDGILFAGTRGWLLPSDTMASEDRRIYDREVLRLEMTLSAARRRGEDQPLVCMMHYPPISATQRETDFSKLLEKYRVSHLLYGHLHGAALKYAFNGKQGGVQYRCVSCDGLDFHLYEMHI